MNQSDKDKKILIVGFALILLMALFYFSKPAFRKNQSDNNLSPEQQASQYPQITFAELQDKIRKNEDMKIIDIRTSDYYGSEHIVDSLNIQPEKLANAEIDLAKDKLIVILGEAKIAESEIQTAQILKNQGFTNVKILQGGMANWTANLGQTISWGNPESFSDQSKVTFISHENLKKYLDEKNPVYVLDVRLPSLFSSGHVAGAVNIPLDDLEKRRQEIPNGKIIITYGDTELFGFQAGVRLYDLNFFSVQVLRSGFDPKTEGILGVVK